ncbi:MAG: sterol desaturase family protein [Cytophagaceae bacterium]
MEKISDIAFQWTLPEAGVWILLENLVIFFISVFLGDLLTKVYQKRKLISHQHKLSRSEVMLTALTILINAGVTLGGWLLWKQGFIKLEHDYSLKILMDFLVIFFIMDFLMYLLHRAGHLPFIYPYLHRTHHRIENPSPMALFVLNPAETLSFGFLWLLVLCCATFSWIGISVYLFINIVFGITGHLGVEPLPASWPKNRLLKYFATSTFHTQHHQDLKVNYGFYTNIWDRLFGTLAGYYESFFGKVHKSR